MSRLVDDVLLYVEENIEFFHQQRADTLGKLSLTTILKRKNPYLFKAKNVLTAEQIVRGFLDAHISSNEESIFGSWLEGLAIFVNARVYGGHKSGIPGIDLEFEADRTRYIVAIKSGPNWGNSSQLKRMKTDFTAAAKTLRSSNSRLHVVAVNGCCYGRDNKPDKGAYQKYCGQRFWEFISNDSGLFTSIIEPLGYRAREHDEDFRKSRSRMINRFTREFMNRFCNDDGEICWEELVCFNSAIEEPPRAPTARE